jgi:tRNA-dihydrouridine synthase C
VNRHRGGAVLLDEPELIARIVAAVRRAVPASLPVSAKMRLGYLDDERAVDCARAIAAGGADEIVVHARTKLHGYRPPAYWERVADVRAAVSITVVANGEIWTVDDAARCRAVSGCDALMLGRGMVADPGLALAIAQPGSAALEWPALLPLLQDFWTLIRDHIEPRHRAGRLKQWLGHLRRRHAEAAVAYTDLRTVNDPNEIARRLFGAVESQSAFTTGAVPTSST